MKILLLGEYSNVHWTLSEGLRALGHDVCVISDGDGWKNYPRDINLKREQGKIGGLKYYISVLKNLRHMRGYDVVQIINPMFLELKAEKIYPFYKYLRRHNKKVFMGAFGMDYYWVTTGLDCTTFRYSDFNIGGKHRADEEHNKPFINDWIEGEKGKLNKYIAKDCDGIITGLYEYDRCYRPHFPDKTQFIPFPINPEKISPRTPHYDYDGIRFFIGIQKTRNTYKGTHIMLKALERLHDKYPDKTEILKAESVPYDTYQEMMNSSDAILDQLYSYTPSMNSLLAMAKGIVVVGGGEEENYEILNERQLRPIVNVQPNEEDVFLQMEKLVTGEYDLKQMQADSITYIDRHHHYIKVAQQYVNFWTQKK
jgi:hypothetical protein